MLGKPPGGGGTGGGTGGGGGGGVGVGLSGQGPPMQPDVASPLLCGSALTAV